MGDRAVITTSKDKNAGIGIYLHWHGDIQSVVAFLDSAKERGYRNPESDSTYAMARLCGLLHEFFGVQSSTSLGIGELKRLDCDNFDNGVYVIGNDWQITDRYGEGSKPLNLDAINEIRKTERYKQICQKLTICEVNNA
jgi:hypothetical protein